MFPTFDQLCGAARCVGAFRGRARGSILYRFRLYLDELWGRGALSSEQRDAVLGLAHEDTAVMDRSTGREPPP